jgi:hypothetical protein
MKKNCLFVFLLISVFACKNHSTTNAVSSSDSLVTKNYFPVASFIRDEIAYVDSTPLAIMKQKIINGQKDSAYIKNDEFQKLAKEFIPAVLTSPDFEKDYIETSFMDQTTESITFTYASKNKEQEVTRIDVLAKPGYSSVKVKSIYMEKVLNKNDTLFSKKMYWKAKHNFQILTSTQHSGGKAVTELVKVIWDDSEE